MSDKPFRPKFKIGDRVMIRTRVHYGARRKWTVDHIYKNGDMVLRSVKKENETIERYKPEELRRID